MTPPLFFSLRSDRQSGIASPDFNYIRDAVIGIGQVLDGFVAFGKDVGQAVVLIVGQGFFDPVAVREAVDGAEGFVADAGGIVCDDRQKKAERKKKRSR